MTVAPADDGPDNSRRDRYLAYAEDHRRQAKRLLACGFTGPGFAHHRLARGWEEKARASQPLACDRCGAWMLLRDWEEHVRICIA